MKWYKKKRKMRMKEKRRLLPKNLSDKATKRGGAHLHDVSCSTISAFDRGRPFCNSTESLRLKRKKKDMYRKRLIENENLKE